MHVELPNHPGAAPARRQAAGYTLIEVCTILVVLGILAAIAVPRLDFSGYAVDTAAQTASAVLLSAQRQAVQREHNVVVAFDTAGARLRIHDDANNNLQVDAGEEVRYESLGDAVHFGHGTAPAGAPGEGAVGFIFQQDGMPALVFHRDGSASEEGGFYITSTQGLLDPAHAHDARAGMIQRSTGRALWYSYGTSGWEVAQ
ncbi:MAG TPA: type II secretion system protein [Longimicrobiaceae bacterium]|nr:type II secretion system protein [Longimicrobiaceae bacterium]